MGNLVTKAKRLIARMSGQEIGEIQKYAREREKVILRREQAAKTLAQWEKIVCLPIGSEVMVNAYGSNQFPRGTALQIDSLNSRGPKRLCLKTAAGKLYNFSQRAIYDYDILPARSRYKQALG